MKLANNTVSIDDVTGKVKSLYIDGFINYSDLATSSVPIAYTAPNPLKLTNDGAGAQTLTTYAPYGITRLWNTVTNQFDFTQLVLGDEVVLRFNLEVTTSAINSEFKVYLNLAIGGAAYSIYDGSFFFKTTGIKYIGFVVPLYMGNADTITYPGELMFQSADNASIAVKGFYISTKRRFY